MNNRDTINQLFERLATAPVGLDVTNAEVLQACGLFISALLNRAFDQPDRQDTANRFCEILKACVSPTQSTQPLH